MTSDTIDLNRKILSNHCIWRQKCLKFVLINLCSNCWYSDKRYFSYTNTNLSLVSDGDNGGGSGFSYQNHTFFIQRKSHSYTIFPNWKSQSVKWLWRKNNNLPWFLRIHSRWRIVSYIEAYLSVCVHSHLQIILIDTKAQATKLWINKFMTSNYVWEKKNFILKCSFISIILVCSPIQDHMKKNVVICLLFVFQEYLCHYNIIKQICSSSVQKWCVPLPNFNFNNFIRIPKIVLRDMDVFSVLETFYRWPAIEMEAHIWW